MDIKNLYKKNLDDRYVLVTTSPSYNDEEHFALFDRQDKPILHEGREVLALRSECHGPHRIPQSIHRGSNVFLINNGQLFVPYRSATKDLYPLCGDISISEHVKVGESYLDAAIRGAQEELGISMDLTSLQFFDKRLIDDKQQQEWASYFIAENLNNFELNGEEIASGAWYKIAALKQCNAKEILNFRDDHWPVLDELIRQT